MLQGDIRYTAPSESGHVALACEPKPSVPFLTDGEELYLIVDWKAEGPQPRDLKVRRLTSGERRQVAEALRGAAEEVFYRLPRRTRS